MRHRPFRTAVSGLTALSFALAHSVAPVLAQSKEAAAINPVLQRKLGLKRDEMNDRLRQITNRILASYPAVVKRKRDGQRVQCD